MRKVIDNIFFKDTTGSPDAVEDLAIREDANVHIWHENFMEITLLLI